MGDIRASGFVGRGICFLLALGYSFALIVVVVRGGGGGYPLAYGAGTEVQVLQ